MSNLRPQWKSHKFCTILFCSSICLKSVYYYIKQSEHNYDKTRKIWHLMRFVDVICCSTWQHRTTPRMVFRWGIQTNAHDDIKQVQGIRKTDTKLQCQQSIESRLCNPQLNTSMTINQQSFMAVRHGGCCAHHILQPILFANAVCWTKRQHQQQRFIMSNLFCWERMKMSNGNFYLTNATCSHFVQNVMTKFMHKWSTPTHLTWGHSDFYAYQEQNTAHKFVSTLGSFRKF